MNVYCAGKTQALEEVRMVQEMCRSTGHTISFDWTAIVEANRDVNEVNISLGKKREYAENDMTGVYSSDLVIAIGHPHLCGTLWECGMAAAWEKPLWLVGWQRNARASVFDSLPNVTHIDGYETLFNKLCGISPVRIERNLPARIVVIPDKYRGLNIQSCLVCGDPMGHGNSPCPNITVMASE